MEELEKTLNKIRGEIKPLLVEMFPDMKEEIEYAYEDNFKEWFAMLFEMHKWLVHPSMIYIDAHRLVMSTSQLLKARKELVNYKELKDYAFISTVLIENDFHLIDGYHRVLKARDIGIAQLRGCVWTKAQNVHPNCGKVKQLIINNL